MRLVLANFGRRSMFEPVLNHQTVVDIEGGPDVASAVSSPVAPVLNNALKLRIIVRSFLFPPSAEPIISRTRDFIHVSIG